jgi:DNA polymerase III alpha subunit
MKKQKPLLKWPKKLKGVLRHIGVHAAGVVISPDPLTRRCSSSI